jgi:hypothetical protein
MFVRKNHARTIGCNLKACVLSIDINYRVNIAMSMHRKNYVTVGQITQNCELSYIIVYYSVVVVVGKINGKEGCG